MRGKVILCAIVFLVGCSLAYGHTQGWDPGTPPYGYITVETSPVIAGENVVLRMSADDFDNQGDPIERDGTHHTWYCRPASGGDWVEIGKSRGTFCTCEGYGISSTITHTFPHQGDYEVKCIVDDCHIWADDPVSTEIIENIHVDYNPATSIEFHYDVNGNRDWMKDPHGQTSYDWDRLHRLTKVTEPDSKWISYEYDWNNNRTKMTDHIEETSKGTVYEYNTRGLLWKLTDRNGGTPTEYIYNDDGSLHTMTYPNGVVATYTYDPYRGWLTHLIHKSGATTIAEFTYGYDPADWGKNGTRTSMAEYVRKPDGTYIDSTVTYAYDGLYRLTGEARTGDYAYSKAYTYDANGNRETMTDGSGTTHYHYDMASKLGDYGSSDEYPYSNNTHVAYDGAGNTEIITPPGESPVITTYAWDWNNKLTIVTEGEDTIAEFGYDGMGTRIKATFGSSTTQFLYYRDKLIAELDGQGTLVAVYTSGRDHRVSRLIPSGMPLYYHGDALGSVKVTTGATPLPTIDVYVHDSWGNTLTPPGGTAQPYQFVGNLGYYTHYQEADLHLLHLGARYYMPSCGRFNSRDPLMDTSNWYAYAYGDPILVSDPSGMGGCPIPWGLWIPQLYIGTWWFIDLAYWSSDQCNQPIGERGQFPFPPPLGPLPNVRCGGLCIEVWRDPCGDRCRSRVVTCYLIDPGDLV